MIYVTIMVGVYRHEMIYVGTDVYAAKRAAEEAIHSAHDDYHAFEVHGFEDGGGEQQEGDFLVGQFKRKDKTHYEPRPDAKTKWDTRKVIDERVIEWVAASAES